MGAVQSLCRLVLGEDWDCCGLDLGGAGMADKKVSLIHYLLHYDYDLYIYMM